jgi:hypothetical protein
MEDENPSILKNNSLITQPNQQVPQVEQAMSPPIFPSSLINNPFNSIQNSNSSILTDNSLILQPTLAPPFPPLLLPPLAPHTPPPPSHSPPLPSVNQQPLLLTPTTSIPFNSIE